MRWTRRLGLTLWALAWLVVTVGLVRPVTLSGPSHLDLLVHAAIFGILAAGCLGYVRNRRGVVIAALLTALGATALEGLQGLIPWRSFELLDIAANLVGTALGAAFADLMLARLTRPG